MTYAIVTPPRLDAGLPLRRFSRHELIPLLPDVLCCIESGVVRTVTGNEQGTVITLGYWGAGDVMGLPMSRLQLYEIQCLTRVAVRQLPKQKWSEVLDAIVKHNQQTEELLSIVHRHPFKARLWQFLVWLGERFGRDVETGRLIELELTHQEIAESINTTRVTVTRTLQLFETEGRLLRQKRQQLILQLER